MLFCNGFALASLLFNSSKCFPFKFDFLKMGYKYTLQNNVIFMSTLHYNDFTFGSMPHATLMLVCTNLGCMYFKVTYFLKKQKSTKVHFIMLNFLFSLVSWVQW